MFKKYLSHPKKRKTQITEIKTKLEKSKINYEYKAVT